MFFAPKIRKDCEKLVVGGVNKMKKYYLCTMITRLVTEIEKMVGRRMQTPRDFIDLSVKIQERTHDYLSATTLKRIWGYFESSAKPRQFTLDTLARFLGYRDFHYFTEEASDEEEQSNLIIGNRISCDDLHVGDLLKVTWMPNRVCVIKYLGKGQFEVVEAQHTKLSVGDTFICHLFVDYEPLFLDALVHEGAAPVGFVAGKKNGIVVTKV